MREANIQGKIDVQFIVEPDGSLSRIKATGNLGYGSAEEAERVMAPCRPSGNASLPEWQANKSCMLSVPITFTLQNQTDDRNKVFYRCRKTA